MKINQIFPFELIEKNSRIIIYGMGTLGNLYIEQVELTKWATIVGVIDKIENKEYIKYPYIRLDELKTFHEYDYIVIGITHLDTVKMLFRQFMELGVPENKIVSYYLRQNIKLGNSKLEQENIDSSRPLTVQIIITGGIGDAVMETSFYERLVTIVPDIVVDICGEPYCKSIYCHKKNVRNIYNYHLNIETDENYDVVFEAHWGVAIFSCDYERVKYISEELYNKIIATENDISFWKSEEVGKGTYLRLKREELKGINRFGMMGRRDIWNLFPEMMNLELDPQYLKKFNTLQLKYYITLNCGADIRMFKDKSLYPTKVWPKEYFEKFIRLFKAKYPKYEIIQIGEKGLAKISGADRYYLGESLELVKYILKYSTLHIDDEGGLVHMGTALGTKCAVLFGPTPKSIFGYQNNINISTDVCEGCYGLVRDWNVECVLGMDKPKCMYSIQPELVMSKIKNYMENIID